MIHRVAVAISQKLSAGTTDPLEIAKVAIEAMREPTVDMLAAAFPCSANEKLSHEEKKLGAAVCMKLSDGIDVGPIEGEAVKQAAFLARDYRIMIATALRETEFCLKQVG